MNIFAKIRRKLIKMRLQPIRVFCFHQVSDTYEENTMYRCDWIQTEEFKKKIKKLRKEGYVFISLAEAYNKLQRDYIRCQKFAVLTADDGWKSLCNILPWLAEQNVPITIFLNPAYLDGKHFRERETERYLLLDEVKHLSEQYPLLTIGSHGWEHIAATDLSIEEFTSKLIDSSSVLEQLPNYIHFYAFPYGECSLVYINQVIQQGFVPVLISGRKNYDAKRKVIDREGLSYEERKS